MTERRLLLATRNPGKIREIRHALKGLSLEVVGLDQIPPGPSPAERGETYSENARAKCLFYCRNWPGLILADDSGLEIGALGGAPGVRSARFSAPGPTDAKNIRKVLRLLRSVPAKDRGARFVCVMVLAERGRVVAEFRGQVRGRIAAVPRGASGFGYDPIFYYAPFRRTFAELPSEKKDGVSHRGRALRALRAFLRAERKALPGDLPDRA